MGKVVKAVSKAVSSVAKSVSKVVSKVASNVGNSIGTIIKNPLPVIETIAITAAIGPEGLALTSSAPAAAAISSAAVKAANGGNIGDIATAAATGAAGSYAGQAAGTAIGAPMSGTEITPQASPELTTLGKITASAVGGSTTTTLKALADGSSFSDAISAGAKTFAAAGITAGGIEGLKAAFDPSTAGTAPIEERSVYAATGESAAPPLTSASDVYTAAQTADGKAGTFTPEPPMASSDPLIGPTESKLLASALYPAVYSTLFGKQQQAPVSAVTGTTTTQTPVKPVSPTQTTAAPGTQALAQALRVGDAGSPIFGGDKEGGKKAGWNVESLRYMGNSEA